MSEHWNSRFPPEFISDNKRLKWEYLFSEPDGAPTQALLEAIDQLQDGEEADFIKKILPHVVEYCWHDHQDDVSRIPYEWLRENLTGAWTIFGKEKVYFENWLDAFSFRVIFC